MNISKYLNYTVLFDSHAHLTFKDFNSELVQIVNEAQLKHIEFSFDMGTDLKSSQLAISNSLKYKNKIFAFVGIDPEVFIPDLNSVSNLNNVNKSNEDKWFKDCSESLKKMINDNKEVIKGIGECGMDYYYLNSSKLSNIEKEKSIYLQKKLFILHLELAQEYNLPLSIHTRSAEKECLEIVKSFPNVSGIFHSYTGDYITSKGILDIGWGLGVNGIVTFKKTIELKIIYKKLIGQLKNNTQPIDFYNKGIFFETDAPFLAPEGKRGERNVPANISIIYNEFCKLLKEF